MGRSYPVIEWNTSEFDDALREYALANKRDLSEIVNDKLLELAGGYGDKKPGALQLTHRADASKLRRPLSLSVATKLAVSRKTKKLKAAGSNSPPKSARRSTPSTSRKVRG
jgi:hypothetical protein